MSFSDAWTGVEVELNNRPLLIRLRELPHSFLKSRYPQRINIFWRMSEVDESGLPTDEEFDRIRTFEDRLVDAIEANENSILVGALTSNGEKELIFHTADVPGFMERLRNMPQE